MAPATIFTMDDVRRHDPEEHARQRAAVEAAAEKIADISAKHYFSRRARFQRWLYAKAPRLVQASWRRHQNYVLERRRAVRRIDFRNAKLAVQEGRPQHGWQYAPLGIVSTRTRFNFIAVDE